MRFRLALSVIILLAFQSESGRAQYGYWYWCEPARAYYPYVAQCPVPWRIINPAMVAAPTYPGAAVPSTTAPTAPPTVVPPNFPAQGDALDEWCAKVRLPSSIAICSDPDLRALVVERQQAYDEAKARLTPEQQKALLADQNEWVKSYPAACGLAPDAPPSLPLAPAMKDCMTEAGRARIAYLARTNETSRIYA